MAERFRRMDQLRTVITKDDQRFVDIPIIREISHLTKAAKTVMFVRFPSTYVFGKIEPLGEVQMTESSFGVLPSVIQDEHIYARVPLRWMKPDGKGGLIPREKTK